MVDMNIIVLQDNADTTELQDGSCDETHHTFCDSEYQQTDVQGEEEPLLLPCTSHKVESEVSGIFVILVLHYAV
jgi:hypothetical protein